MLKIVLEFLRNNNWEFSQIKDKHVIFFGISGEIGNFQCVVDINEEEHKFSFFSICGANAPLNKRIEILDILNQINYNHFFGNFEMDPENGEIRYKTSLFYEYISPNLDLVDHLIMTNIITMDTCLPAIMGILFGGLSSLDAMNLIDSGYKSTPTIKKLD